MNTLDILKDRLTNKLCYVRQAHTNAITHREPAEAVYFSAYRKALLDTIIELENVKEEYENNRKSERG